MISLLNSKRKGMLVLPAFLFLFFCLSFVQAQVDSNSIDDTFKINSIVDYSKPCRFNGTFCDATSQCNFTVKNPNNVLKLNNIPGTINESGDYNVSINFDSLGIWTIEQTCCQGIYCNSETHYSEITGSGFNNSIGFYALIILISVLIMGLGLWKRDAPVTVLGTFGLYFLGIYTLFNGIGDLRDPVYTWAFSLIILAVAFYVSGKAAWEMIGE
jgi:hypothetical protein